MSAFVYTLKTQIEIIIKGLPNYLEESPISTFFLFFILFVFILNIIKRIFIEFEKKCGSPHQSCQFLIKGENGQDCDHRIHRKHFIKNNNSCIKCRGMSFKITDAEAENRIAIGSVLKRSILLMANYGKNMLPYISFIYTLIIAIIGNNK